MTLEHQGRTSTRTHAVLLAVALSSLLFAACKEKEKGREAEREAIPAEAVTEANTIFSSRCSTCHGPTGAGDGPASAGLSPRPRNFGDPQWQDSVTDEHIERIIMYGGAAVGKSPTMPANPDLQSKPDVVRALRQKVRGFRQGG